MTDGGNGERTFVVPTGLANSVEVVGENRKLQVSEGTFSDDFASEASYHIYKIAVDSSSASFGS